jgi:hypothetical protein
MNNLTFWMGTGVGFLSALSCAVVVAWLQYRLKIKELKYIRAQEKKDREQEETARKEAERQDRIAKIRNLREGVEHNEQWRRIIDRNWEITEGRGMFGRYNNRYDFLQDYYLDGMDLPDLQSLYTTMVNVLSLAPVSQLFDVREREVERLMNELSEALKQVRGSGTENSQHP